MSKSRYLQPRENQLPLWNERVRGLPNSMARSALFTCADKRKPRRRFERTLIVTLEGYQIFYTGEELRQDDLSVWLQAVHLARQHPLGTQVEVTGHALAMALGWGGSKEAYTRLRNSIARLREGAVWVVDLKDPEGRGFSGNFVMSLDWKNAGSGDQRWTLYFDPSILRLFQPDGFTLQDWEARLGLTPLAQWAHGFFTSHASPYPIKAETLFKLSGSTNSTLDGFKRNLARALEQLKENALIADFSFDARTKMVHVINKGQAVALAA